MEKKKNRKKKNKSHKRKTNKRKTNKRKTNKRKTKRRKAGGPGCSKPMINYIKDSRLPKATHPPNIPTIYDGDSRLRVISPGWEGDWEKRLYPIADAVHDPTHNIVLERVIRR